MSESKKTYPKGTEKFNADETILRVGDQRARKIAKYNFRQFSKNCPEETIQNEGILAVNKIFMDDLVLNGNSTGMVKIDERYVRFGIPGEADANGLISPFGTRLEVEFKAPGKKQSEKQIKYQAMIEKHGGLYLLCDGDILNQLIIPIKNFLERMESKIL